MSFRQSIKSKKVKKVSNPFTLTFCYWGGRSL